MKRQIDSDYIFLLLKPDSLVQLPCLITPSEEMPKHPLAYSWRIAFYLFFTNRFVTIPLSVVTLTR